MMNCIKHLQHLLHNAKCTVFPNWTFTLKDLREIFSIYVVHHIINGAILLKEVIHPHQMRAVKPTEPHGLLGKLIFLCEECPLIIASRYSDSMSCAQVDATDEKLLHRQNIPKSTVFHFIGVAKSTTCQLLFYTICSIMKHRTYRKHILTIDHN